MVKPFVLRSRTEEEYKKLDFYSVGTLHRASDLQETEKSKAEQSVLDALTVILRDGPFTKDEMEQLLPDQLQDYLSYTHAILHDFGIDKFKESNRTMRTFLIRRLARGQSLLPSEEELDQRAKQK
jgi:hypothetical protein